MQVGNISAFSIYYLIFLLTRRMSARLFACSIRLLSRLYFLYSARSTPDRLTSSTLFCSIRSVIADTAVFIFVVFIIVFYFFLRTGEALCVVHICLRVFYADILSSLFICALAPLWPPMRIVCDNELNNPPA